MNWGKGIIVAFVLFIGFIVTLVVILMSKNVDLQSEDYYKKEINYQEEITQQRAANDLKEKVKMQVQDDFVVIQLPDSISISAVELLFMRPDNDKDDQRFLIEDTKSYLVPKAKLKAGKYLVEMRYSVNGISCLQKEELFI